VHFQHFLVTPAIDVGKKLITDAQIVKRSPIQGTKIDSIFKRLNGKAVFTNFVIRRRKGQKIKQETINIVCQSLQNRQDGWRCIPNFKL